jgi:oligosaccharyltransferase complex subunit beta
MNLVNYENYQLYNLIKAEHTTFSKNYKTGQAIRAGSAITLVAGVQGLNNARALLIGSLHFFSNEVLSQSNFGNKNIVVDLLKWVFREKGVIRVKSMSYHGEGV